MLPESEIERWATHVAERVKLDATERADNLRNQTSTMGSMVGNNPSAAVIRDTEQALLLARLYELWGTFAKPLVLGLLQGAQTQGLVDLGQIDATVATDWFPERRS